MGSPVSPIVATSRWSSLKEKRCPTSPDHRKSGLGAWMTLSPDCTYMTKRISQSISTPGTRTETESNRKLPFLDTCVLIKTEVTIYRKPTHTDQYLNFNLYHHLDTNDQHGELSFIEQRRLSRQLDKEIGLRLLESVLYDNSYKQ